MIRIGHPPRGPRLSRHGWPEDLVQVALGFMILLYLLYH